MSERTECVYAEHHSLTCRHCADAQISALQEKIKALEGALRKIAQLRGSVNMGLQLDQAVNIAKEALGGDGV